MKSERNSQDVIVHRQLSDGTSTASPSFAVIRKFISTPVYITHQFTSNDGIKRQQPCHIRWRCTGSIVVVQSPFSWVPPRATDFELTSQYTTVSLKTLSPSKAHKLNELSTIWRSSTRLFVHVVADTGSWWGQGPHTTGPNHAWYIPPTHVGRVQWSSKTGSANANTWMVRSTYFFYTNQLATIKTANAQWNWLLSTR